MEATGKDFALTGIVDEFTNETVSVLFASKVRSIALRSEPEQVLMVDPARIRGAEHAPHRAPPGSLAARVRAPLRRLLDSSRDAIAYVHEGMHVRANRAYLEMFGYESFEEIEGMTLLDMVASENADDFKALLKRLSRGEKPPKRVELKAVSGTGESFDATAEFAQATFEGEPCLQIIFRRKAVSPELVEQLQRDSATGMYNRSRMLELIEDAVGDAAKGTARPGPAAAGTGQLELDRRGHRPGQHRRADGRDGRTHRQAPGREPDGRPPRRPHAGHPGQRSRRCPGAGVSSTPCSSGQRRHLRGRQEFDHR